MQSELILHEYKHIRLDRAMVILGFPSVGLVSSIAANFIVKQMKLEKVAAILSDEFPPYSIVHEGEIVPPMRIYAGSRVCDDQGEKCEHLVVISSEFLPATNLLRPLVSLILDWCRRNDVNTVMCLEGINVGEKPEQQEIMAVATGERCRKMLATYGLKEFKEGMVSGVSGILLYEGDRQNQDAICLLGPAHVEYPDPRSAARLLEQVAKMLPELKLDPEPLFKEAETIEKDMRSNIEKMRPSPRRPEESMLYG